jgi:hypothetical protein
MSDPIDNELRSLMAKMVEASPAAPEFDELFERAAAANESALTTVSTDNTTVPVAPAGNPVVLNGSADQSAPTADDFAPNSRPRSSRVPWWQRLLAGVGIAGIAAGGAYGFAAITADDGGADSAEKAAQVFMEALDNEDLIGAAETLDPGERDLALTYMPSYLAELDRMGLVSEDADLNNIEGGDINANPDDLVFSETVLTDNRSRVDVTGFSYEVSAADLPLSDRVDEELNEQGVTDDDIESAVADTVTVDELPLVAVQRSDGWYVSLAYTAAEFGLDRSDWSRDTDVTITPAGAGSPEDAATAVVEGVMSGDGWALIATLDPVEAAVVYDYMPIAFHNGVQATWPLRFDGTALFSDDHFLGELITLEWSLDGSGERRTVTLAEVEFVVADFWKSDGADQRFVYRDRCILAPDVSGRAEEISNHFFDETARLLNDGQLCADSDAEDGSAEQVLANSVDSLSIEVVDRDGEWFVAPATTMLEWGLTSMRNVPDDVLDADSDTFGGGVLGLFTGVTLAGTSSGDGSEPSEAVTVFDEEFESGFDSEPGDFEDMEVTGRGLTYYVDDVEYDFDLCLEGPVASSELDRVNECFVSQHWAAGPVTQSDLEACVPVSDEALELGLTLEEAGDEVLFCLAEPQVGFNPGILDDVRTNCDFYLDRLDDTVAVANCLVERGLLDTFPTDAQLEACSTAVSDALIEADLPGDWFGSAVGQCLQNGRTGIYVGDDEVQIELTE